MPPLTYQRDESYPSHGMGGGCVLYCNLLLASRQSILRRCVSIHEEYKEVNVFKYRNATKIYNIASITATFQNQTDQAIITLVSR